MINDIQRRQELAQFLRTRREQISPEAVGLLAGPRRRTPGLRREELSQLAGIGVTWYTRLEQGQDIIVSSQILESLARIFNLNATERNHLFILARDQVPTGHYPLTSSISPQLQCILDTMGYYPAYVTNPRWDIVGWNSAMGHVFPDFDVLSIHERNIPRFMFNNPLQRTQIHNWENEARGILAQFRASSDRYVREPWFNDLIAELQQASPEFREWWPQHDIQSTYTGYKELNHPLVGELVLQSSTFQVVDVPDLLMFIVTAADAKTERKLLQLAELIEVQHTR